MLDHRLVEGLMEAVAPIVIEVREAARKEIAAVRKELAEVQAELALVKAMKPEKGEPGQDGKDGRDGVDGKDSIIDLDAVALRAAELIPVPKDGRDGLDGKDGKDGADGKSFNLEEAAPEIRKAVAEIYAANPPADGKDGRDGVDGKDGSDGTSVTIKDVEPMLNEMVDHAVSLIEVPQPKELDPALLEKMVVGRVAAEIAAIPPAPAGKDAVGISDLMIDQDGRLIVMLTDGSKKDVGRAVGRDADSEGIIRFFKEKFEELKPRDGKDGLGFEDLEASYDDDNGVTFRFLRGDQVKEFTFYIPRFVYEDVYVENREKPYEKGDAVTWGGSMFIAKRQTNTKPGSPEGKDDWRLAVKRGRDGRDGRDVKK